MVSNAREDLPDPETPVTTVKALWAISKSIFLRLWTRAPRTTILSFGETGIWQHKAQPFPQGTALAGPGRMAETSYYKRFAAFAVAASRRLDVSGSSAGSC